MLASKLLSSKQHQRGELSWGERKDFSPGKSHSFEVDGLDLVLGLPGFARTLRTPWGPLPTPWGPPTFLSSLGPSHLGPGPREALAAACCPGRGDAASGFGPWSVRHEAPRLQAALSSPTSSPRICATLPPALGLLPLSSTPRLKPRDRSAKLSH